MQSHETAGALLVPAKPRNLPHRILRAFDQAMHLKGLPRGARDTLAELCRFVPQNLPFQSVFAHKKTIAERLGLSERSLYRHLAVLEEQKLIEILDQDRKSRNGRFTVARIRLTRLAAALIGLIEAPELLPDLSADDTVPAGDNRATPYPALPTHLAFSTPPALSPPPALPAQPVLPTQPPLSPHLPPLAQHQTPTQPATNEVSRLPTSATFHDAITTSESSTVSNALTAPEITVIHTPPSANMSGRHTLSEPTSSKNQPPTRTENGVPADLTWLSSNGLSRAGIFKLMGLAKSNAKRLSDIALAVHQRLAQVKGGRLFSYLAKLIAGPSDFAVAAAVERRQAEDAKAATAYTRKARAFRERFRNVALTDRKQSRLYLIDGKAEFVQVLGGPYSATMPLNDLREWIDRVEKGLLVMATLEIERRFCA